MQYDHSSAVVFCVVSDVLNTPRIISLALIITTHVHIAAVSDPGHFGAAVLFGPTVCLKCSATHTTPAHRCLLSPWSENPVVPAQHPRWALAFLYPGCHWPANDSAPFLSCVICDLGGPPGPVIVTNRLVDLALEGLVERAVSSTYLGACCRPLSGGLCHLRLRWPGGR